MDKITFKKRFKNERVTSFVDKNTGELIESVHEKSFSLDVSQDTFYITFIRLSASELTSMEIRVLSWLCENAEYNTGICDFSKNKRAKMMAELVIETSSYISNILKKLSDGGYIKKDGSEFMINPAYFWKGQLKERNQAIKSDKFKMVFNVKIEEVE